MAVSGRPARVVVVTEREPRHLREFPFDNLPGAGCQLALSPDGTLAACASLRHVLVARPATGEVVRERRLAGFREERAPALGARRQRLVCLADGQVLWLRGQRVVDVDWEAEGLRYLPQEGLCEDIAFDHERSRLALVNNAGRAEVWQWTPA